MEKKAVNKKTWIIIGIVVALLAVLGVVGFSIARGGADRKENLLELGQRYLDELNYEQAIACFEEYLEIDPKSAEAYAGLAQAYVGLEEYEKALEVLANGYAATGEGSLQELSSRIEEQYREWLLAEGGTDAADGTDEAEEGQGQDVGAMVLAEPLGLDAMNTNVVAGNGGVIITLENGTYGAINYQGEVIVPHTYSGWWTPPTDDGYFALGDWGTAHVFNAEGQEVYEINAPLKIYISDGGVLYIVETDTYDHEIKWHDLMRGTTIDMGEYTGALDMIGMSSMQDGTAYFLKDEWGTPERQESYGIATEIAPYLGTTIYTITKEGVREAWAHTEANTFSYAMLGPKADGYIPFTNALDIGLLREADGKECHIVREGSVIDGGVFGEFNNLSFVSYYGNGMSLWNKGAQMVLQGESYIYSYDEANGPTYENYQSTYFLLDLTNAEFGTVDDGEPTGHAVNPNDYILAQYDYIQLSDSGYYLASDGKSYFYLDERGQKVDKTFLDCGAFYNGYAIILDMDGMAYLIDTEFNKVSEGYPADGVWTAEAVYCALSGDQVTVLTVQEE